jgi:hypothetical protein
MRDMLLLGSFKLENFEFAFKPDYCKVAFEGAQAWNYCAWSPCFIPLSKQLRTISISIFQCSIYVILLILVAL